MIDSEPIIDLIREARLEKQAAAVLIASMHENSQQVLDSLNRVIELSTKRIVEIRREKRNKFMNDFEYMIWSKVNVIAQELKPIVEQIVAIEKGQFNAK